MRKGLVVFRIFVYMSLFYSVSNFSIEEVLLLILFHFVY